MLKFCVKCCSNHDILHQSIKNDFEIEIYLKGIKSTRIKVSFF